MFISFRIPHSQIEQREELQKNLINTLNDLEYDFMAVACPASQKVTTEKGNSYLGCILLGLSAKSSKVKSNNNRKTTH